MKKILLTLIALGAVVVAVAQKTEAPASNAILVSQTRNGNVVTSHYKIPHNDGKQAEFDVRYAINRSEITPGYSNNSQEISDMQDFMAHTQDSTMHISSIHIVGYASPDGNERDNDSLAQQRAKSLYVYAASCCPACANVATAHKALHWSDCIPVVEASSIPNKDSVLAILKSTSHTEPQKERALRGMPEVWSYLAKNVLPQMRYADIEFDYGVDEYFTRTTTVEPTKPAEPTQTPQPEPVVVEEEVGVIIATPQDDGGKHKRKKSEKGRVVGEYEAVYW
jgi:hypothetical protein